MLKPKVIMTCLGAAGDATTGSCTLLNVLPGKGRNLFGIVDAGIFQGKPEEEERNFEWPINSRKLDFVIITHSHMDHVGALPLLRNYRGKIYGTTSALRQAKELLLDSAKNYERNAAEQLGLTFEDYKNIQFQVEGLQKRQDAGHDLELYHQYEAILDDIKSTALYTEEDVYNICTHFCPISVYDYCQINDLVCFRLIPETHINGAASVELYVGEFDENSVNIAFSGDLGPSNSVLYKNRKYKSNPFIKYLLLESLHGVEVQKETPEDVYHKVKKIMLNAQRSDRTVILGVFSLDRSASALMLANRAIMEKNMSLMTYFDAPLGYRELLYYKEDYAGKSHWFKDLGKSPFDTSEVIVSSRYFEHVAALEDADAKVIIASSAMGYGGRMLDIFDRYVQDANADFVFLGYLHPDSPSSILHNAERMEQVELNGLKFTKVCNTYQFEGLTSHGYFPEMLAMVNRFPKLNSVFLNHAETDAKEAVKDKFDSMYHFDVVIPEMYNSYDNSFFSLTGEKMEVISREEGLKKFKDVLIWVI